MPNTVSLFNGTSDFMSVRTTIDRTLSERYWSGPGSMSLPGHSGQQGLYWIDRSEGITDGVTWIVTSQTRIGGSTISFQLRLIGTLLGSDIALRIVSGGEDSGWQTGAAQFTFTAADGENYTLASSAAPGLDGSVTFAVVPQTAPILTQIEHVVVLMMENRSLDNLLGWIYPDGAQPSQVLPAGSPADYDGLNGSQSNSNLHVENGDPIYASNGTTSWIVPGSKSISQWSVPSPDPGEEFAHVTTQISNDMTGFLTDYSNLPQGIAATPMWQTNIPPAQIMQCYSVAQLPIISTLAQSFAVSDAWFASVPSQTWPNRGFVQTGSSDGHINNDDYVPWDIPTIFDVLGANGQSWMVYNDGAMVSLTKSMFLPRYIDNDTNFASMTDFQTACSQAASAPADQKLPAFSFVEPNFGIIGADESYHPPHDVRPAEAFLSSVYAAIEQSPYRDNILFIVMFDEHGGTYDHVEPPIGSAPPQPGSVSRDGSFKFNRFGVRIPAIVISSYVTPGTVFRSNTAVPLDHTSILATIRDWKGLQVPFAMMLPSPRIAAAPTLDYLLTESAAQPWATLPSVDVSDVVEPPEDTPLNGVQISVLLGTAAVAATRPLKALELATMLPALQTQRDGRAFAHALAPQRPLR